MLFKHSKYYSEPSKGNPRTSVLSLTAFCLSMSIQNCQYVKAKEERKPFTTGDPNMADSQIVGVNFDPGISANKAKEDRQLVSHRPSALFT